jgi:hypothetical protein
VDIPNMTLLAWLVVGAIIVIAVYQSLGGRRNVFGRR